ncbi:hypothetical protein ScPMuIL_000620 [Solemya velum]
MSYVLIMSNPDGDKEGGTKQIALDMSNVYDFKEEGQEIVEEIMRKWYNKKSCKDHSKEIDSRHRGDGQVAEYESEKPEEQMLVMDLDDMTATNKGAVTAVTATTDSDIQAVVHTVVDNTKASQVTEGEEGKGVVGSDDQTKEAGTQAAFESESESEEEEGQEEEGRALEKEPMHIEVIIPEANLSEAAEIIYSSEASVSGANEFSTHAVIDSCTGTTTLTIPASMLSNLGAVLEQDPTSKDLMKVEVLPSPAKRPRLHE